MTDSITTTSEDDDLYYFETDHLALKGNRDYSEVIKTLFILCAQRKQAIEDYKKAVKLKEEALNDPIKILEKIVNGESLNMPDKLRIPELPIIDWSKYNVKIPENILKEIYSDSGGNGNVELTKHKETLKKEKYSNRKWSLEEQKRLEELLQIYPPEPIEMKRFKKIADALGNRSVQQVSSRVQKYFLKLYKAGLPIPGRIPKSAERNRKSALHKHQRHNHYLWKPSTFFPDLCLPVTRSELHDDSPSPMPLLQLSDDKTPQPSTSNYLLTNPYSEENNTSTTIPKTDVELQLELLKRIKMVKMKENEAPTTLRHFGFKCDYCNDEPIIGTRWHCITCNYDSIDFCTDCVLSQLYSDNRHPLTHILNPYNDEIDMDLLSDDMESNSGSESRNNDDDDDDDNSDSDGNNSESSDNDEESVETTIQQINDNSDGNLVNNEFFNEIDNISYDYLHTNLLLNE